MPRPHEDLDKRQKAMPLLTEKELHKVENWCNSSSTDILHPETIGQMLDRMLVSNAWHNLPPYGAAYGLPQTPRDVRRYTLRPLIGWHDKRLTEVSQSMMNDYVRSRALPANGSNAAMAMSDGVTVKNRQTAIRFFAKLAYGCNAITYERMLLWFKGSEAERMPRKKQRKTFEYDAQIFKGAQASESAHIQNFAPVPDPTRPQTIYAAVNRMSVLVEKATGCLKDYTNDELLVCRQAVSRLEKDLYELQLQIATIRGQRK
jgi:hypothetical protein